MGVQKNTILNDVLNSSGSVVGTQCALKLH